jgi:hypothetical protein
VAKNLNYPVALRNAQMQAVADRAGDAPVLRIYSGSQPSSADASATGTWLADVTCGTPFEASIDDGVLTATAIEDATVAVTGTAGYFRIWQGGTIVCDGTVGTSDADLILDDVDLVAGGTISISSLTLTCGNA